LQNAAADAEGPPSAAEGETAQEALYSPVDSAHAGAVTEASGSAAAAETAGEELYFPVNAAAKAAARPQTAPAPEGLKRRRRALMESVSPAVLLLGGPSFDPRSYTTAQTWLASLKETGMPGAARRSAA
jgi:hypothetical protein